jgi:VWFA-related protein
MKSMARPACLLLFVAAGGALFSVPAEEPVVFRSEVTLVRVDAQVVDRENRAIAGLRAEDFILLEEGREQPIRNFEREEMPVDILLLLDVSGSMRPHVERIATAAGDALETLGDDDRVAVMVFDRSSRLRLPFRGERSQIEHGLNMVLQLEDFNGGTDITRGLLDAAAYMSREGRKGARRAIVILTDDQTERGREEERVSRALAQADTVLSALLAPDAMRNRGSVSQGGSWPSGPIGGPMGGPLGGIIFGRRGPYGRRMPGPVVIGGGTRSAGTAEIARRSGGDSLQVDEASAFERTLARIRQRYALYFHLPQGVKGGQERTVDVQLSSAALRRYPDAQVNFRRVYLAPGGSNDSFDATSEPVEVSQVPVNPPPAADPTTPDTPQQTEDTPALKRRPAVSERSGPRAPTVRTAGTEARAETAPSAQGGWRRVQQQAPGRWRRATPADLP